MKKDVSIARSAPIPVVKAEEFEIVGRGKMLVIKFKENNLKDVSIADNKQRFLSKLITYKDVIYKVIGIETHAIPMTSLISQCGLLVKMDQ